MPVTLSRCFERKSIVWAEHVEPSRVCPVRRVPAHAWLLELWTQLERGNLPRAGGTMDQPAWIMDALRIVAATAHEALEKARPKHA